MVVFLTSTDLDKYVGDLHSMIVDRELEIVQDLLEEILKTSDTMLKTCDVCAELDVLLSLAQASRLNGYSRPEMVRENIIDIVQGRCEKIEFSAHCSFHILMLFAMETSTP